MFRTLAAVALAAAASAPALADQMTMDRAIQAASLHDGPLDMVAYYRPAPDGALEVTATFAPRTVSMMAAAPTRMLVALAEGDDIAFAIPGYPQAIYRFARAGETVTVSVRPVAVAEPQRVGF